MLITGESRWLSPKGLRAIPSGLEDVRSKLRQAPREPISRYRHNRTGLRSLQSSPSYQAELDLVIVNPQGESVAYCMGWIEENDPKSGYIEPMGTHTDYRRNGFGTALAKECFKRLGDMGVETVSIASDAEPDVANSLYESLSPASTRRAYRYSLSLEK